MAIPSIDPLAERPNNLVTALGRCTHHDAITLGSNFSIIPNALYFSAAGTCVLRDADDTDRTYAVYQGQILPFGPKQVVSVSGGLTAADIIAWWS